MSGTFSVSVPDCSTSLEPFWRSLREAVEYGEAHIGRADPARCFRAEALRPPTLAASYADAVSQVLGWRRAHVDGGGAPRRLETGRLLVYFPGDDLSDGTSSAESEGFFDVHSCPPWGIWVGFFVDQNALRDAFGAGYLVAWVPPELVELASRGIEVNADESISWLDDSEVGLRAAVAAALGAEP